MMSAWLHEVAGLRVQAPRIARGRRPLWAYAWPAGLVLAELVATRWAAELAGKRVLELGCGLGAVGLVAAKLGAQVTLADREPEALAQAAAIAEHNGLTVATQLLEWGRVPEAMTASFELVLGADIMYDPAQLTPMLGAVQSLLARHGVAYLADPDRADREALAASARTAGLALEHLLTVSDPPSVPTSDESHKQPVHIYRLSAAAGPGEPAR